MRFLVVKLTVAVFGLPLLSSCATTDYQASSFDLIVEGNEASYPAFEAAANACGYTAYLRFPGAAVKPTIMAPPHFNLSRIKSRPARCTMSWVSEHPETGLRISGE